MLIVKFTKYMYLKNSFLFKYRTRCLISFVCIFFLVHIPFCPLQVLYLHLVLAFLFKIKSWIWIYKIQELLKTELTYPLRAPKTHGWGRATRDAKYGGREQQPAPLSTYAFPVLLSCLSFSKCSLTLFAFFSFGT